MSQQQPLCKIDNVSHRGYNRAMSTATKKSAYIRTRIRPQIKRDAERVLHRLGISTTDAIAVFLQQVALQEGLPFAVKIPNAATRVAFAEDVSSLKSYANTETMFNDILGKDWRKKSAI